MTGLFVSVLLMTTEKQPTPSDLDREARRLAHSRRLQLVQSVGLDIVPAERRSEPLGPEADPDPQEAA
jgi:hypothetical protein